MKTSVVIIAKNEPRIKYTLDSLIWQVIKPDEVIVVVDDYNDPVVNIIKSHLIRNFVHVKIVVNDSPGYGGARKCGVENSEGDIVIFISADAMADNAWIQEIIKAFYQIPNLHVQAGRTVDIHSLDDIKKIKNNLKLSLIHI